jgi:hypothetical protein
MLPFTYVPRIEPSDEVCFFASPQIKQRRGSVVDTCYLRIIPEREMPRLLIIFLTLLSK